MSKVTLQIIAQVTNQATGPLKNVQKGLKDTADAANKTKFSFTELNRALFSTKAFFGIFSKVFNDFKTGLSEAANMQRVEDSFKGVFGEKSDILSSIDKFSTIGVDRIEAMKDAISLGMLGIAKNSDQAAQILAGAAYGAKQAGVDTSEGMSKIVQGLKDGSLSGLEYLNMIRSSDPVLKAQLELLNKYSGSIGGAVTAQAKFNLIMSITSRLSELAKKDQQDLTTTLVKLDNSFGKLKQTVGTFLGVALGGIINSLRKAMDSLTGFIQDSTKADKGLIYFAKSVIVATTALSGLYAVMYSIKMISTILATTGAGFPFLGTAVLALGAMFLTTTQSADTLIDKLKLFGNFIQGVYQLVTNLDTGTGLSKIDKDIKDILDKNGIWKLTQNISRGISVIRAVLVEAVNAFDWFKTEVSNKLEFVSNLIQKFNNLDAGAWSKSLIDGSSKAIKVLGIMTAALTTGFVVKKFAGVVTGTIGKIPLIGPALSKIPLIGSAFRGGETGKKGPSGNPDDPIYTKDSNGLLKTGTSLLRTGKETLTSKIFKPILSVFFKPTLGPTAAEMTGVTGIAKLGASFEALAAGITPVTFALAGLLTAIAAFKLNGAIMDRDPSMQMFSDPKGWEERQRADQQKKTDRQNAGFAKVGQSEFLSSLKDNTYSGLMMPESQKSQYYAQHFGIPSKASFTPNIKDAGLESLGLDPKTHKVAYVPNIPKTGQDQMNLLMADVQNVNKDQAKDMTDLLKEVRDALIAGMDPDKTGEMIEKGFTNALHKTKDPVRPPTSRRGC